MTLHLEKTWSLLVEGCVHYINSYLHACLSMCKRKGVKKQIKIKIFTKNGELRGKLQNRLSGKRGQLSKVEATHQDDLWEEAWQLASHCEVSGRRVIWNYIGSNSSQCGQVWATVLLWCVALCALCISTGFSAAECVFYIYLEFLGQKCAKTVANFPLCSN